LTTFTKCCDQAAPSLQKSEMVLRENVVPVAAATAGRRQRPTRSSGSIPSHTHVCTCQIARAGTNRAAVRTASPIGRAPSRRPRAFEHRQ